MKESERDQKRPFDEVFIFPNGMVIVKKRRHQIAKYQGDWTMKKDIIEPILKQYPEIRVYNDENIRK